MNHIFYLDSCSTCRRIIKELEPGKHFHLQNLKIEPISATQLDMLAGLTGSYVQLFNKQSRKYREMGLFDKNLSENDVRDLILQEYTFLKRPIFLINNRAYICRNKETINQLKALLDQSRQH